VISKLSDGLQTMPFTSSCKEFTGFPRRNVRPIIRFRKPLLYPLSYGSGTSARSSARKSTLSLGHEQSSEASIQIARYSQDKDVFVLYLSAVAR
jgi:hypothetical protein